MIGEGVWHLFLFLTCIFNNYPRNTYEKILYPQNIHEKKFWTHKIPTGKNFRRTKYPWEKISDPQKTHEKKFRTRKVRWYDGTRPTMARNPRNLAHSFSNVKILLLLKSSTSYFGFYVVFNNGIDFVNLNFQNLDYAIWQSYWHSKKSKNSIGDSKLLNTD